MRVLPLSGAHDLRAFRSGTNVLDHWLRRRSHANQCFYGMTYVAVDDLDHVLAYVTVAATAIARGVIGDGGPDKWPALLLARMAVARSLQGKGIGVELLRHVFTLAVHQHETIGCAAILVDAKPSAVGFYEKHMFLPCASAANDEGTPQRMFLGVEKILEAIGSSGGGAGGAGREPGLEGGEELRARDGDGDAGAARGPAPGDERVVEVVAERGEVFAAVGGGIAELEAEIARGAADEDERLLGGGHAPAGGDAGRRVRAVARGRVRELVAGGAFLADAAVAGGAALHVLDMRVRVVALQRLIARGVAVLAARMLEDGAHGFPGREAGTGRGGRDDGLRRPAAGGDGEHAAGGDGEQKDEGLHACSSASGSERRRWPVSAKRAFATAGAMGAVAGSPMPPILAPLWMMWTETSGISLMRRTG
jgi:GNAT superfamily N-acetyltransferase